MTALLAITGVLLLVSGAVKARSGQRSGLGIQPLTLVELVVALACSVSWAAGLGATRVGAWLIPAGLVLVIASSGHFMMRMAAFRRERAESEARRLKSYLQYLAATREPGEPEL